MILEYAVYTERNGLLRVLLNPRQVVIFLYSKTHCINLMPAVAPRYTGVEEYLSSGTLFLASVRHIRNFLASSGGFVS